MRSYPVRRTRSIQRLARSIATNKQTDRHRSTLYYRYVIFFRNTIRFVLPCVLNSSVCLFLWMVKGINLVSFLKQSYLILPLVRQSFRQSVMLWVKIIFYMLFKKGCRYRRYATSYQRASSLQITWSVGRLTMLQNA